MALEYYKKKEKKKKKRRYHNWISNDLVIAIIQWDSKHKPFE